MISPEQAQQQYTEYKKSCFEYLESIKSELNKMPEKIDGFNPKISNMDALDKLEELETNLAMALRFI